jgi:hypothetical protein
MTEAFDLAELKHLAYLPEITLDVYQALPEDVCMQIEVVDGWLVRCESPSPATRRSSATSVTTCGLPSKASTSASARATV